MSLFGYRQAVELEKADTDFYALIMAAMRRADDFNLARLKREFPEVWTELEARYNAPRGLLPGERDEEYTREELDDLRKRMGLDSESITG